jgi:hypothetical protein
MSLYRKYHKLNVKGIPMSRHFINTHVHLVGAGRSFTNLQGKIRTVEDVINFNSRYPEIYQARLTEDPVDISDDLIHVMNRYWGQISLSVSVPSP